MITSKHGFTLVELLISLTVGLILVLASLTFALTTFQGAEANKLREEVYRNARFLGMSLQRDVQSAGVGVTSTVDFGTLSTFGDTVVVLAVPWEPTPAPAYALRPPVGIVNPLPPGGTCGPFCLDLEKDAGGNFDLAPGDLARLQVSGERRLLLITTVRDLGATFQITFLPDPEFLHYEAAFAGGLLLDRFTTTVQRLDPVIYFMESEVLYRARSFTAAGALEAHPMAYGVTAWDSWLVFEDLDEAVSADPGDADPTNDFDDLLGLRVAATLSTTRSDIRVNDGDVFERDYEWRIMPRNLMYERNR